MRRVVLFMNISLDGFIADPAGNLDDFEPTDEEMDFANEMFGSAGGVMFGRSVYEGFVSYWDALDLADESIKANEIEFARIFRGMTRVVFSTTLDVVPENAILIRENIADEVDRLKEQPGGDLLLVCGPSLLATLAGLGLVDEYRLLVRPIALVRGISLFGEFESKVALRLTSTRKFASGTVLHVYDSPSLQP